jgi:hypothetical protein
LESRSRSKPGCLSRILTFIHPGSRIQQQQQKRKGKKLFVVLSFLVATNLSHPLRIEVFFNTKIVTKLSKLLVWDPESDKKLYRIPDPGVKKVRGPRSGFATVESRNPDSRRAKIALNLKKCFLVLNIWFLAGGL